MAKSKSTKSRALNAKAAETVTASLRDANKRLDAVADNVERLAKTNPVKHLHWGDMEVPLREVHGLAAGLEIMADGIHDDYTRSAVAASAGAIFDLAKRLRGIFYTAAGAPDQARAFLPDGGEEGGAS